MHVGQMDELSRAANWGSFEIIFILILDDIGKYIIVKKRKNDQTIFNNRDEFNLKPNVTADDQMFLSRHARYVIQTNCEVGNAHNM